MFSLQDLSLLFPELAIAAVVAFLAILEISLPKFAERMSRWTNALALIFVLAVLIGFFRHHGKTLDGLYVADSFSYFFKFLFLFTAVCVFAMPRTGRKGGEFTLLFWSALLGMFFLVSSNNFLLFFVSLELLTLSLYVLTAYTRTNRLAIEAGLKYLILGSLASAFLLYGISLIYAASGTLSFEELGAFVRRGGGTNGQESLLFLTGVLLVLSALGFKVAAVPFQVWVPDVYQGAPTPVVAFLSVASKSAGFAGLLRILLEVLGPLESERRVLFSLLSVLTLFYGNLGALVQTDMKRLLGFSSIGHAGFLLAALTAQPIWMRDSLLYYLLAYGVTNLTAFLVVSLVEKENGSQTLEAFRGLSQRSPLLAGGFFLALLSLAGVPPLAGFFSKFFVLYAVARSGLFWLVILGGVNVAISLYYYLNVVRLIYFEKTTNPSPITLSFSTSCLLYILLIGMVLIGTWQAPFFHVVHWAGNV